MLPKNFLWSFGIWSKLERWKSLISGCLMSWPKIKKKKKCCFAVSSSLILCNNEPFLNWIVMKSQFYMTSSNSQLSGWIEKKLQSTSQSQTCTKKRSWSQFGGLMPDWSTTTFWILVKQFHLRNMLSKSMRGTKICNAYSWHWSTEQGSNSP